jgi:tetratricopeptide (TPR) repeat protein
MPAEEPALAEDRPLFVAREEDVRALTHLWEEAKAGQARVVRLQAPFGGGRRAVAGELVRQLQASNEDAVIWRVTCLDQENGLQWLVRMYGSLVAQLTQDVLKRGRIELLLTTGLPSQPKRVQGWYQEFISSLKEAKTDREKGAVQLRIPKDNPLIGLVEVAIAIARKVPILLELQAPYAANSLAVAQFLEALHGEARHQNGKLLVILHDEPEDDTTKSLYPMPLLDYYTRGASEIRVQKIEPWGEAETKRFLDSKGLSAAAPARIAAIAKGRPGFIAELVEILEAEGKLGSDLADVSFSSLVPMAVDAKAIDVPTEPPAEGQRKHATADDVGRVAFFAALLGQVFPSNLVADMGGFDRDSIDDLVDAAEDLFEEVQFSEELGTWLYKFKRGSWREGVVERNDTPEGQDLARRVGLFMERFLVPRGYAFIARTARVYAEHGAGARANLMRSLALTNDSPDVWGLSYDLIKYFDEVAWPDAMRRTVYMNLIDRLVANGTVQAAEQVHTDATEWATRKEDRDLLAWLLFAGSRLDSRRQDMYRARDRARDALKLYEGLNNDVRRAEIHNHLAGIELQDGNPNAALENVNAALALGQVDAGDGKKATVPGILANAEYIKGVLAGNARNFQEAAEHFKRANEIAGQVGLGALALDAGLSYGEMLLATDKAPQGRDVLERVVNIAKALRNPVRERRASELLGQAEARLKNFVAAITAQTRVLELSRALKFDNALPIDLYNLGFFNFAGEKPTEALAFFRQAEPGVKSLGNHAVVKELYYFMGLAHLKSGNLDDAKASLRTGLRPAQQAEDWRKMVSALDVLAQIEEKQGNPTVAKKLLADAIGFAEKGNLREERKNLRRRLDQLAG